jgi:subtilase family serine protease
MNNQPTPGGNQNNTSSYSEAIAREHNFLRQTLNQLAATERDLEAQRVQLQGQIDRYLEQAPAARRMNRPDLADEALARVAQLQPELARVQQQLAFTVARQREITARQFELLRQTSAFGSAPGAFTSPQPLKPGRPKRRWRLVFGLSIAVILVVLVPLGLGWELFTSSASSKQGSYLVETQLSPTPTATPSPAPTPLPPVPAFHPNGTGPTNQQCLYALGAPCYSPEQIQQAFGLTSLYRQGYDGLGQTIVILGAGNTATLQADLHHFDQTWGLPDPPSFQIIHDATPAPYSCPDKHDDLRLESTLDVEWAHAMAPGANITMLVGSNTPPGSDTSGDYCSFYGLSNTLNDAVNNQLGQVISISYGGSELGALGETAAEKDQEAQFYEFEDSVLQQAATNHITVLAATGDNGVTNPDDPNNPNAVWQQPNISWPASDPYVLAVGGTTLQIQDASGAYGGETVWNDGAQGGAGGGGLSAIFPAPSYQYGLINQELLHNKRGIPDVSFPAEPSFDLYASFETGVMGQVSGQWRHWGIIGGTSIATPCWAGLIAIANQMYGKPIGFVQPALYRLHGRGMHDITSGNNSYGGVQGYSALRGYDLASGWGTPIANQFIPDLIQALESPDYGCPGYRKPCG